MSPQTVIFANGLMPEPENVGALIAADARIVAADGGARHALALGLIPDLVIGDLDSITPADLQRVRASGAEIERHPVDKDATDLELALDRVQSWGSEEVLLLGAWGGRLDQSLANLFLLANPRYRSMRLSLASGRQTAWIVRDQLVIRGQAGDIVSVLALSPQVTGLTYDDGLRWRLQGVTLSFGSSRGVSNEMTAPQATIRLQSGVLLVMHQMAAARPG